MNLLTIADGFGDSAAVPPWYPDYIKWPEIIKLMTKNITVTNLSRYGAGNEYIIYCLKNNITDKQAVLLQWAVPKRLDLVLSHSEQMQSYWQHQIAVDPVYSNNIVTVGNNKIWLSSATESTAVKEYHQKYIGKEQHRLRSLLYIDYAKLLLANIQHGFLLTQSSAYLEPAVNEFTHWHWHEKFQGMCEFRHVSEYADLDLGLVQPIPLIHFDFVRKFVQPRFDLPWRSSREISAIESMLFRKYKESVARRPK